ncbi:hypothetical protein FBU30_001172 [Linnemannia zychae]|nr:hypothetical protein FBU30_001172 [Linnemannia zychae]
MVAFIQSSQQGSFLVLAAIVTLIMSSSSFIVKGVPPGCTNNQPCCPSSIAERQECGYVGITQGQCLQRECCFDGSALSGPQCFEQKTLLRICPTDRNIRTDCGFNGISKDECSKRKCCWDESASGMQLPQCFNTQRICIP